jgi:hypothetical protein
MKWAGEENKDGFAQHSIFYSEDGSNVNEDNKPPAQSEDKPKPLPENQFQPFLSYSVACDILERLFLAN